jgi:Icc-related predicted phosphoesterase
MANILCLSDIHCQWQYFKPDASWAQYDAIIIAGDITNRGDNCSRSEWYAAYGWFEAIKNALNPAAPLYFIGGNHDFGVRQFASHVSSLATWLEPGKLLKTPWGDTITGANLSPCHGMPSLESRWAYMTADVLKEKYYWNAIPPADILVTHCPPEGVLDDVGYVRIGSQPCGSYITEYKPKLVICGHVHEEAGGFKIASSKPFKGTSIYNVATITKVIKL